VKQHDLCFLTGCFATDGNLDALSSAAGLMSGLGCHPATSSEAHASIGEECSVSSRWFEHPTIRVVNAECLPVEGEGAFAHMSCCCQERAHIPYRDSKLTQDLGGQPGGNSKTTMMCMISPAMDAFAESLSTLKFANRWGANAGGTAAKEVTAVLSCFFFQPPADVNQLVGPQL